MAKVRGDISRLEGTKYSGNRMVETQKMYCPGCARFLGFQAIVWGVVKIKCPNCGEFVTIDIRPDAK